MFSGRSSILKNIAYLTLLVIHAFLFLYFLYNTFFTYITITICSLTAVSLVILAFYSFLTSKSYYLYFYIGIIICSSPIIFIVPLSAILIVPELIILAIFSAHGLESGTNYFNMRVDKKANLFQHDPAVTNLLSGTPKALAFRMEEVWNPDSAIQLPDTEVGYKRNALKVKMQIVTFLLTIVYFISSVISVYLYILTL